MHCSSTRSASCQCFRKAVAKVSFLPLIKSCAFCMMRRNWEFLDNNEQLWRFLSYVWVWVYRQKEKYYCNSHRTQEGPKTCIWFQMPWTNVSDRYKQINFPCLCQHPTQLTHPICTCTSGFMQQCTASHFASNNAWCCYTDFKLSLWANYKKQYMCQGPLSVFLKNTYQVKL